jgi:hypothetical protein
VALRGRGKGGTGAYYVMPHSTSAVGVPIKRQCQYSVIFSAACDRIRPVPGLNPACPVP